MSVHDRACSYCGETTSPGTVHNCPSPSARFMAAPGGREAIDPRDAVVAAATAVVADVIPGTSSTSQLALARLRAALDDLEASELPQVPGFRQVRFHGGTLDGETRLIREPVDDGSTYARFVPVEESWTYRSGPDAFVLDV